MAPGLPNGQGEGGGALGPRTPPNLNISTIRVRDPWVSIQIKFWTSLLSTKEVSHTCKIVNYF